MLGYLFEQLPCIMHSLCTRHAMIRIAHGQENIKIGSRDGSHSPPSSKLDLIPQTLRDNAV
jgi:hypothetical protein